MIEILYFDGCPNHEPTLELTREVVAELGLETKICEVRVETPEEATERRFIGSPSVRVNGRDIEPEARGSNDFAFSCRMYGESRIPPKELLVEAIRELDRARRERRVLGNR